MSEIRRIKHGDVIQTGRKCWEPPNFRSLGKSSLRFVILQVRLDCCEEPAYKDPQAEIANEGISFIRAKKKKKKIGAHPSYQSGSSQGNRNHSSYLNDYKLVLKSINNAEKEQKGKEYVCINTEVVTIRSTCGS